MGVIADDSCPFEYSFRVTCGASGGRLKGTASTDKDYLQVTPDSFEGSSLEFSLSLDTATLEAGHYNAEISLITNSGEFKVPVSFRKSLKWDIIAGLTARIGIPTGLCMYCIRLILVNHLSVGLDDSWLLSYPPEVKRASFLRLLSPLAIGEIPEVQLTCSLFGGIIISAIIITLRYLFCEYFEDFREEFSLKLEALLNLINESTESFLGRLTWNNHWRFSYYYSSQRRSFIYKTAKIALLLLLIVGIVGFFTNFLLNIFALIGSSLIVLTDLTTYSLTRIGIRKPEVGWLVLGCFTGGVLGLVQALKRTEQYSLLSKIYNYKNTIPFALILLLNAFLNWNRKPAIDYFPKLVLQENFKFSAKSWSLQPGTTRKYGGLFRKEPNPKTSGYSLWSGHKFKEVDFSADAKKDSGSDNVKFGIFARYTNGNFYYLLIKGDRMFAMEKYSETKGWEDKIDWKKSTAIKQGNKQNRLRIVCTGKRVIGWVNDQRVGVFEDGSYNSGQIGVISARGDGDAVAVYFDNVLAKEKPE